MIILDTNVISEPLRSRPDVRVINWLDDQAADTLYLTSLTVAEILYGIEALRTGRRRTALSEGFGGEVLPVFEGRILDFDLAAADCYGALRAGARSQGMTLGDLDALIAAVAVSHGFAIATRDTTPFRAVGVEVINPFD